MNKGNTMEGTEEIDKEIALQLEGYRENLINLIWFYIETERASKGMVRDLVREIPDDKLPLLRTDWKKDD